jgi:CRISPR-associated protein Csd2
MQSATIENVFIPRVTGLLIIEARNSNPNGDPDRESDPRTRAHDGKGVISDVSFKRKLRELVLKKDGPVWLHLKSTMNLNDDKFGIHVDDNTRKGIQAGERVIGELKKVYEKANEIAKKDKTKEAEALAYAAFNAYKTEFCGAHWDVRVFGSTSLETEVSVIRSGVAQFGIGVSSAKVRIQRDTNTVRAGVDVGKDADRGMAPLGFRVVEHGVYAMPFLINPTAAKHSGCTLQDIELLCRLIPYAYPHNASRVRPMVEVRHAWYFEHKSHLGSASDFKILDALGPKKEDSATPSNEWADYGYNADLLKTKIKTEFAGKFNRFADLADERELEEAFPEK